MNRLSCFLPAVECGETTLTPSPMVTEFGLSLCIRDFLQKGTPMRIGSTLKSSSHHQSPPRTTTAVLGGGSGVEIFKNCVPLFQSSSSKTVPLCQSSSTTITDDASDMLLHSIICDSLSNVSELVCDMFNLTL
jgi:hypothetical protein